MCVLPGHLPISKTPASASVQEAALLAEPARDEVPAMALQHVSAMASLSVEQPAKSLHCLEPSPSVLPATATLDVLPV